MLVTIITVCLNSNKTIEETILSVLSQSYNDIQYILIDGGSTDGTLHTINKYKDRLDVIVSEKDNGIYDAMNKGLLLSKGKIIGILNSDDLYSSNDVISHIVDAFYKFNPKIVFGDLIHISNKKPYHATRYYNAKHFKAWKLRFGWMPPHPASFFHKSIYDLHGHYLTSFKTGADYEMFVRLLLKQKLTFTHVNKILIKMRTGGATSSGFNSIRTTSFEMVKALRLHGFYANLFIIYLRLPFKFFEKFKYLPKILF